MNRPNVLVFSLALAGYLVAGFEGALTALVATVIGLRWRDLVPGYAFGALVLTAVVTVVERVPSSSEPLPSFVSHRQAAASLGAVAGVLVLVSIVLLALAERAPAAPAVSSSRRPARPALRAVLPVMASGLAGAGATGLLVGSTGILVATAAGGVALVVGCGVAVLSDRRRRRSS